MSVKCPRRVPYHKQSTPTTCWHAALAILADYHGYQLVTNIAVYLRCLRYMKQLELTPELAKRSPPSAAGISVDETNALCNKNALDLFQAGDHFRPNEVWEMIEHLITKYGPLIVLIREGDSEWVHWIVVTETVGGGVDSDKICYHDPAIGPDQKAELGILKSAVVGVLFRQPAFVK
jgi:hypothetical protein